MLACRQSDFLLLLLNVVLQFTRIQNSSARIQVPKRLDKRFQYPIAYERSSSHPESNLARTRDLYSLRFAVARTKDEIFVLMGDRKKTSLRIRVRIPRAAQRCRTAEENVVLKHAYGSSDLSNDITPRYPMTPRMLQCF